MDRVQSHESEGFKEEVRAFRDRNELEQLEHKILAPCATFSDDPQESQREYEADKPDDYRTALQRDWHRITHCEAFRKLEFKTQVFVYPELGDTVRNRLTHTLEATQIARSIGKSLGLNEDLIQAITLAHDLGHPPFGHAGETELNEIVEHFNHNEHGYKIVTYYERRYEAFHGLNLTFATREGILKHETDYDKVDESIKRHLRKLGSDPKEKPSLEAQAAAISDQIAYRAHDIEDAMRSGLISRDELKLSGGQLCADILEKVANIREERIEQATVTRFLIRVMVTDVVEQARKQLQQFNIRSLRDVRECEELIITFSREMGKKEAEFGKFLMNNFYLSPTILKSTIKGRSILNFLFSKYKLHKRIRPHELTQEIGSGTIGAHQAIAEYLARLTDRSAIREFKELSEFAGV